MRTYTQISSGSLRPGELTDLIENLSQLDIHVTPSPVYNAESLWQTYSAELKFYKSIAKSAFHILYNHEAIDSIIAMQVVYALYKRRPVVMIGRPVFSERLDPELRAILEKYIRQFHAANLLRMEFAELSFILNKLKPEADYKLTHEEKITIITKIREHLYDLVGRGIGETNAPLR
ncbi:hypothetical protein TM7_0392 [candidate division TM7 genomosp. GTL1]|nr:hypothetical protein TM7_0392 [candidate division TM7 genomosp. GTL1]